MYKFAGKPINKLVKYSSQNWYLFVIIFIYFLLAFTRIDWLGFQADEVNFSNVARWVIEPPFIDKKVFGFPIFIMPYIGAFKGYLYFLILKIFSLSYYAIRLPLILLVIVGLIFTYEAVVIFFNRKVAFIAMLLLVLNATFIELTVFDVGPNVIEFLLHSILLLLLIKFIKNKNKNGIYFLLFVAFSLLGIYNKLNFIWFILAMVGGWMVFFFDKRYLTKKYLLTVSIPFMTFMSLFIKYKYWQAIDFKIIVSRFLYIYKSLFFLLSGESFFLYLGGAIYNLLLSKILAILILIFSSFPIFLNHFRRNKSYLFFGFVFLIVFSQVVITKRANGLWHLFMVMPYIFVLFSFVGVELTRVYRLKTFFSIFLLFIFSTYFLIQLNHYKQIKNVQANNNIWNKAITKLQDFSKSNDNIFILYDWGIYPQLILSNPQKGRYLDYWSNYMAIDQDLFLWINYHYYSKPNVYFIGRSEKYTEFNKARSNFFKSLELFDKEAELVQNISGDNGDIIFEIYKIRNENKE